MIPLERNQVNSYMSKSAKNRLMIVLLVQGHGSVLKQELGGSRSRCGIPWKKTVHREANYATYIDLLTPQ